MTVEALPPGRYIMLIQGYTSPLGESGYAGSKITVKPRAR
jgi:hypothetical protein